MKKISVAIDGPAGAGKSSISKAVAKGLAYLYIDTGAMYRAVTYYMLNEGISISDESAVTAALVDCKVELRLSEGACQVLVNGADVTPYIRSQEVTGHVSQIASYGAVRRYLVDCQRAMAQAGGVILDGRDIGSVVLPNAELKIYLTASVAARAKRRWLESQEGLSLEEIQKSVEERDYMDSHRKESPLVCVPDAVVIDSSDLTIEETIEAVTALIKKAEAKA